MTDSLNITDALVRLVKSAVKQELSRNYQSTPATVVAVNGSTVDVKLDIKNKYFDYDDKPQYDEPPTIEKIPIEQLSSGGFSITTPIKVGDKGFVDFSSNPADSFLEKGEQTEFGGSVGSLNHAVQFKPRSTSPQNGNLDSVNHDGLEIRSGDGSTVIRMSDSSIELVFGDKSITVDSSKIVVDSGGTKGTFSPSAIILEGNTTVIGNLGVTGGLSGATAGGGSATLKIQGNSEFNGNIQNNGGLTSTGTINGSTVEGSTVQSGGINLSSHRHTGVQTGGGTTGNPI